VTLFVALAPLNKSVALLAAVIGALPWALFLAVPVASRGSLILVDLSDSYANAAGTLAPGPVGSDMQLRYATAAEALRFAVPEIYLVYGILMWAWFTAVGIALIRLSRRTPALAPPRIPV